MTLNHTSHGIVELIELPRQLVTSNAHDTHEAIDEMIGKGYLRLILDLRTMINIDPSGITALLSTIKTLHTHRGEAALLNPSEKVRSLIEQHHLQQEIKIFEDRNTAILEMA